MTAPVQDGLLRGQGPGLGAVALAHPFAERTMLHVLRRRADDRRDHRWLVFDGEDTLTFGEAQSAVNRVAHAVVATVSPGAHIGLLLRNQVEFIPALYGTMAAASVGVPINAEARGTVLHHVIEDSDIRILITRPDMLDRLRELDELAALELIVVCDRSAGGLPAEIAGTPIVAWDAWQGGRAPSAPLDLPHAWDTATIQFTSGTTGRSKGAVYPHHFFYLYSATQADSQERVADDVLTTPLPLYHAAALHHVAGAALHVGCTAHLSSKFSASGFWPAAADAGATFAIILGAMAQIMLKTVPVVPPHRLEHVFCVPPPPDIGAFERHFGVTLWWQGYGMTEISPIPMPSRMEPDVPADTVGHPCSWFDYGVVDAHDLPVPTGEVGQLVFRPLIPHAMASEYYKRPDATVEALRNGMFHTGDMATLDDAGRVHYRGRGSDRIRVRGENVTAAELEAVACEHEVVLEAAAYAVPGEFGEDEIKLDVRCPDAIDLAILHEWLTERLPKFMVPRYLEQRTEFPRTGTQKIEKFRLAREPLERPTVVEFPPSRGSAT